MTYYPVQSPYPIFNDEDGTPLEDGYIYIGEAYQNPITNFIPVSWDTSGLYPAAQPIRTIGGYPDRNGSPGIIYVNAGAFEDYSILVQDKHGNQIYFEQSARSAFGGFGGNSLDIISDLRAISGFDQPIYVRGHTTIGDGGQGKFEWFDGAAPGTYVDDNGVTIVPAGGDGSGAWVRQYIGAVSIAMYGGPTGIDDTTNFVSANTANLEMYVPAGTYYLNNFEPLDGTVLTGAGRGVTIIWPTDDTGLVPHALYMDSGSASIANNVTINIRDITWHGYSETTGFVGGFNHLVSINGVSDSVIERCDFIASQADGIYIGSSSTAAVERHNVNCTVRDCFFDGRNNDNRNAISIIDGDGILIENCYFKNWARSNMPGAIDMEPDAFAFPVMKNIRIINNTFEEIGGNVGVVALQIPATCNLPENIWIENNKFLNIADIAHTNADINCNVNRTVTAADIDMKVRIVGNSGNHGLWTFRIFNGKGYIIDGNKWQDYENGAYVSFTGEYVRDIEITNNYFRENGNADQPYGISVFGVDYLTLDSNHFIDIGKPAASNYCIDFTSGTSSYVHIWNNLFSTPNAITTVAIQKEAAHTFTPATNSFFRNTLLDSLGHSFQSESGDIVQTFVPVIEGASTVGVGTYTANRYGYYQRRDGLVFFTLQVETTAHTGTGIIEVSLPPVTPSALGHLSPVTVMCDGTGLAYTAGDVIRAYINTLASTTVGTGAVRLAYETAAGSLLGKTISAASTMTIYLTGCYLAAI